MNRLIALLSLPCIVTVGVVAQEKSSPVPGKPTAKTAPAISVNDLESIVSSLGKRSVVRGKVQSTGKSKSGINFLNFRNNKFVALCFPEDLVYFKKGEPADLYKNKTVEISGVISKYKETFQIKVFSPDQVKIVATSPVDEKDENKGDTEEDKSPKAKAEGKDKDDSKDNSTDKKEPTGREKIEKNDSPIDPDKFFDDC